MADDASIAQSSVVVSVEETPQQWAERAAKIWTSDFARFRAAAELLGVSVDAIIQNHLAGILLKVGEEVWRQNEHWQNDHDCQRCHQEREIRAMQLRMMRHAIKHLEEEERGDEWKPPTDEK